MNAKTKKLFESAYGSAHVCADITEKMAGNEAKLSDVEILDRLLDEARSLAASAQALNNAAHGIKSETTDL